MTYGEQYTPGPASGAQIRKGGEKWTLILVRELRHSPEKVCEALTDPAQLREWAPFEVDGSPGTVGTVKLIWVGTPTPLETIVTRAEAPKVLEYNDTRWELEPFGGGTRLTLWSIAASARGVLPGGTLLSMFWIAFSAVPPSAVSLAVMR